MQPFSLTVLGSSSALPAAGRHPSAHVLQVHERFYLIDCGEGTQMQLRRFNFSILKIEAVFITHLHGDHYYGLPGLLGSMHLLGRKKPLNIFAPPGLREIIELQHRFSDTFLHFPLEIHEVTEEVCNVFSDERISVKTFPLKHRIPCNGYLFEEVPADGTLDVQKAEALGVPKEFLGALKRGVAYVAENGKEIKKEDVVHPPPPPRKLAYCSDTLRSDEFTKVIQGASLLYHEATFMEVHRDKAKKTWHSTAKDAAEAAAAARVKQLLIGHFSARYYDSAGLLAEARALFPNTLAAEEGRSYPAEH
ncbi:MAG: ribonuclease Z [Bacteroidia bacterium]|nr:ribonuclease Z [Bacteroidia bacterium]